jgi:hypothetical protein
MPDCLRWSETGRTPCTLFERKFLRTFQWPIQWWVEGILNTRKMEGVLLCGESYRGNSVKVLYHANLLRWGVKAFHHGYFLTESQSIDYFCAFYCFQQLTTASLHERSPDEVSKILHQNSPGAWHATLPALQRLVPPKKGGQNLYLPEYMGHLWKGQGHWWPTICSFRMGIHFATLELSVAIMLIVTSSHIQVLILIARAKWKSSETFLRLYGLSFGIPCEVSLFILLEVAGGSLAIRCFVRSSIYKF